MGSQSFKLTQHLLGMNPYCLVQMELADDGENLNAVVEFGAGPESGEEAAKLLWLALMSMPGGMKPLEEVLAAVTTAARELGQPIAAGGAEWAIAEIRESVGRPGSES